MHLSSYALHKCIGVAFFLTVRTFPIAKTKLKAKGATLI